MKTYCCRHFKADQQTKGPPMGSRMLAPISNNNVTSPGFNAANQNTMGAVMQPVQSSPLNMYNNNNNRGMNQNQQPTLDPFASLL